jgi:hypothetical protein
MTGSRFDDTLELESAPVGKGPLEYKAEAMHVWVIQTNGEGQAAAHGARDAIAKGNWEIPTELLPGSGAFAPGPAFAFAMAIVDDDGTKTVVQWSQPVDLVPPREGAGSG